MSSAHPEPNDRWEHLLASYLEATITEAELAELQDVLRNHPAARDRYLAVVRTDTLLREIAGKGDMAADQPATPPRTLPHPILITSVLGSLLLVAVLLLVNSYSLPTTVAHLGASFDAKWLSEPQFQGGKIRAGSRLKLAAGSVEVRFRSGAFTRINGPALFEVRSANSGFLHYGEAFSIADTPKSQGFTIATSAGNFIDQGTQFLTTASLDGYSQLRVTSGAVDADVEGFELQRLNSGSSLGIEPGDVPVMIRIEQGDETPAFRFPTIPPPSASDYADQSRGHARVEWWPTDEADQKNRPHAHSGPPELLIDGRGQRGEDEPSESVYFYDGANGLVLLDLGQTIPISQIRTYSWHRSQFDPDLRRRAVQRYTLWGCGEAKPSSLPTSAQPSGWTRIARVNTDTFFRVKEEPDRPPQQACSLFSAAPAIGEFRYLLFEVVPTPLEEGRPRHTFFGEIDVFRTDPKD